MGIIDVPNWRAALRDRSPAGAKAVPIATQPPPAGHVRPSWPLFVVGFGLVATVAWMTLLGWLLYRAALMLV